MKSRLAHRASSTARRFLLVLALLAVAPMTGSAEEPLSAPTAPTGDASEGPSLTVEAEVFGGLGVVPDADFSEFDVHRVELGATGRAGIGGAEVRVEAIRTAVGDSLLGLDGNSLALRVKRAFGFAEGMLGPVHLEGRLGLIADPWIEALESHYDFRGLAPLTSESGHFFDTSDAGLGLVITGPSTGRLARALRLSVAFTNGEGRNETERNAGKNTTLVLSLQPEVATLLGAPLHVGAHFVFRDGSAGTGEARNNRLGVGVTARHPRAELGLEWIQAEGYGGLGTRNASGLGVWAGGQILPTWLGAVVRYETINPDTDLDDTSRSTLSAALFTDLGTALDHGPEATTGRLRLHAGLQQVQFQDNAGPVPGHPEAANETRLLLWVAGTFAGTVR